MTTPLEVENLYVLIRAREQTLETLERLNKNLTPINEYERGCVRQDLLCIEEERVFLSRLLRAMRGNVLSLTA